MIQSWKTAAAKQVFEGKAPKGFPSDLVKSTRRRLAQLHSAADLKDLKSPPGNKLHPLEEDRKGQWAIYVNDQFRICFKWGSDGPEDVEFIDYH